HKLVYAYTASTPQSHQCGFFFYNMHLNLTNWQRQWNAVNVDKTDNHFWVESTTQYSHNPYKQYNS
ncbi:MAG: hypothetical protein ACKPKO_40740, partial [Candidatus Fonsibacter sp.]